VKLDCPRSLMLARARIDVCCSVVALGLLGVTANLDDCPGAGADASWLLGAVIGVQWGGDSWKLAWALGHPWSPCTWMIASLAMLEAGNAGTGCQASMPQALEHCRTQGRTHSHMRSPCQAQRCSAALSQQVMPRLAARGGACKLECAVPVLCLMHVLETLASDDAHVNASC
jgi:hypothetical protein